MKQPYEQSPPTHPGDTQERILDAAEYLFAHEGYRAASLRAVTGRARVNLAAVNYHFGSKRELLEAVFERRIGPLNKMRRERLADIVAAARRAGTRPRVDEVMRALVESNLVMPRRHADFRHLIAFLGRSFVETDSTAREAFEQFMRPMFRSLFETLSEALPDLPPTVLYWRIHFAIGAISRLLHPPRSGKTATTPEELVALATDFLTAGMLAPCGETGEPVTARKHPTMTRGKNAPRRESDRNRQPTKGRRT